jgi:CHASE3 domain sensor protein
MKFPLIRRMQLGFGAVVVVLLVDGVIAYRGVLAAAVSAHWSEHTRQVLEHLDRFSLAMDEIARGYRDFASNGDDAFLKMSRANSIAVDHERDLLRALTADNPDQTRRLASAEGLAQQAIQSGDTFIRLRRTGGTDTAVNIILIGQVDPLLGQFHSVVQDMEGQERGLLNAREAKAQRDNRRTKIALIIGSTLALVIAAVSSWMVPRYYAGRRDAEGKLRRVDRLYAMVSGITALGVRVRDRADLFKNSCRIAVEHGEFEMAWIGIIDRAANKITPVAWAGLDEEAMTSINALFATSQGTLQGPTLAARAIKEKAPVISHDVQNDESLIFGKMHAKSGVRSIAVLPLMVSDQALGVFVLYTHKLEFFDAPGLTLLMDLAANVAFAVDNI